MIETYNVIYTGAFLDKAATEKVLSLFSPKFKNIFAHHLTITYRPNAEDLEDFEVGAKVNLKIIGIAEDDRAQALVVDAPYSSNKHPHITLSTNEGVEPVYSNELLEKGDYKKTEPFVVPATLGFFDGQHVVTKAYPCTEIILPTRSQPDTIAAIFILKKFGHFHFPGIEHASYSVKPVLDPGETGELLLQKGIIALDVGGGLFDHHTKNPPTTASALVAEYLGVSNHSALSKILQYVYRDDVHGKGIISEDPLDRAFGLSGLIAALNKIHSSQPEKIIDTVLPFFEAHFEEEYRRTEAMPKEVEEKIASGAAESFTVKQGDKKLKCIFIESDNVSLAGFLRSQNGGRYDVVLQRLPSNHTNILTRPTKRVDLRNFIAVLRRSELMKAQNPTLLPQHLLRKEGRIDEVPEWYFDPATNSLLNGGILVSTTPATRLSRGELIKLAELGLSIRE